MRIHFKKVRKETLLMQFDLMVNALLFLIEILFEK